MADFIQTMKSPEELLGEKALWGLCTNCKLYLVVLLGTFLKQKPSP